MHIDEAEIVLELISCEVCLNEIPVSAAKTDEAAEYVHYFCGLECYAIWRAQADEEAA